MLTRIAVLLACIAPAAANAYYLETRGMVTDPVRYAAPTDIEYRVNPATFPDGVTGIDEAIDNAFQTWTDAACATITFAQGADSTETNDHWTRDMGARYILVYFTDSDAEWTGGPAVGHFFFGFDGPTGNILGATVVLNSRDHSWATDGSAGALDVQSIVTALIGRSMGITSAMEGNATYPLYMTGDISKRTLGTDDIAAIQHLYLETGCAAPTAPEMICDGVMMPGEDPCPPRPVTMPPDGGMMIEEDAGMTSDPDAGMSDTDAGTGGPDDGGCSCRASGEHNRTAPALLSLVIAALAVGRLRRG